MLKNSGKLFTSENNNNIMSMWLIGRGKKNFC